ncbi:MAG: HD family phosphohydrolase [Pirellulaceae bacterium]|jgi:putative nucleotidyltransferase with HDIG domain
MTTSTPKKTRSERVASLQTGPSSWDRWKTWLLKRQTLQQLAISFCVFGLLWASTGAWNPPFPYRIGDVPGRSLVPRISFQRPDLFRSAVERNQRRREVQCVYENRPQPLVQLRGAIKDQVLRLADTQDDQQLQEAVSNFLPLDSEDRSEVSEADRQTLVQSIRQVMATPEQRVSLERALEAAMQPMEARGVLKKLGHGLEEGNQRLIQVLGADGKTREESIDDLRTSHHAPLFLTLLQEQLKNFLKSPYSDQLAQAIHRYAVPLLPETLVYRNDLSDAAREEATNQVQEVMVSFLPGVTPLAAAERPLNYEDLDLLRQEHAEWLRQSRNWVDRLLRTVGLFLVFIGSLLFVGLCIDWLGLKARFLEADELARLVAFVSIAILLANVFSKDPWRAEVLVVSLAAFTAVIAYGRSLGLILMLVITLLATLISGWSVGELVVLWAAAGSIVLFTGRIRNRTRLMVVGLSAAAIVFLATLAAMLMEDQILTVSLFRGSQNSTAGNSSPLSSWMPYWLTPLVRNSLYTLLAGALMTGLLPLVERAFEAMTDLSLLELGDASHPILRQLAQKAPGTYNHSINVAALGEAAADHIGANGLLVRVGAYFHDIGKMFQPQYFVENQSPGSNPHDGLQPAMSTLIIVAHVKDGADLARQHHLPQSVIDFIEQHHGTTLVEYFYKRAAKRLKDTGSDDELSDIDYRYPGPKPQTREAAVLMLADAVESAARTLVEPTPSRIQGLVEDLANRRLADGQFDECQLTLHQLAEIRQSLVKSLIAIYHGRVKYQTQSGSSS